MSLIHICELCGVNAFDYLTGFERHADELSSAPQNYFSNGGVCSRGNQEAL